MRMITALHPRYLCLAGFMLAAILFTCEVQSDSASSGRSSVNQERRMNLLSSPEVVSDSSSRASRASQQRLVAAYGKLPLSFEINQGQTDPRVKFLSRGSGYALFLTSDGAVLTLRKGGPLSRIGSEQASHQLPIGRLQGATFRAAHVNQHGPETPAAVLRMKLVGANAGAKVKGLEQLPGKSNYFIGKDPRKWRTNVPNYARVKYSNVYPGVDLVYYGNQGKLEYDFFVQPGANLRRIKLALQSSATDLRHKSAPSIDRYGNLIVSTDSGEVRFHKPVVYQPATGEMLTREGTTSRHFVDGKYAVRGKWVSFEVANYDKTKPLVIDPTLAYSTYLGESGDDFGSGIAVDASGNAYVTGGTGSSDFPVTSGALQTTFGGPDSDAFISKLNAAGSALVYSTYLGGSAYDFGHSIAIDPSGDVYVAGQTTSSNFPTTPGAFQTTCCGAFVTKIAPDGSALAYSTYLGGSELTEAHGIAIDASGSAYVTGFTYSSDFPITPGAFQSAFRGFGNAFVTKLNAAGSALLYSTYLRGSTGLFLFDEGDAIAVDSSGSAYVTGVTDFSDFPTTPGAFQTTFVNNYNAFVTKFNATGSALVYSTFLEGSSVNFGEGDGIALDGSKNAYVIGCTYASDFPTTPGAFQTTYGGAGDAFVTKLNVTGSALIYSTYLGGTGFDGACRSSVASNRIIVDSLGDAYVTGDTSSSDFPTTPNAFQSTYGGGIVDAFVSKLNSSGSALVYSSYLGGGDFDRGGGIALDSAGNAYVTGVTESSNFPTTAGAFQTTLHGGSDAFISKFSFCAQPKTKRDCKNGGWRRFCEPAFKNQGQCVTFVNHHE